MLFCMATVFAQEEQKNTLSLRDYFTFTYFWDPILYKDGINGSEPNSPHGVDKGFLVFN